MRAPTPSAWTAADTPSRQQERTVSTAGRADSQVLTLHTRTLFLQHQQPGRLVPSSLPDPQRTPSPPPQASCGSPFTDEARLRASQPAIKWHLTFARWRKKKPVCCHKQASWYVPRISRQLGLTATGKATLFSSGNLCASRAVPLHPCPRPSPATAPPQAQPRPCHSPSPSHGPAPAPATAPGAAATAWDQTAGRARKPTEMEPPQTEAGKRVPVYSPLRGSGEAAGGRTGQPGSRTPQGCSEGSGPPASGALSFPGLTLPVISNKSLRTCRLGG